MPRVRRNGTKRFRRKQLTRSRRKGLHHEHLEPRQLLSGDPLTNSQQDAFRDGIAAISDLGGRFEETPVVASGVPLTTESVAGLADLSGLLAATLQAPADGYLDANPSGDLEGLASSLQTALAAPRSDGLVISSPTVMLSDSGTAIDVHFSAVRHTDLAIDLATALAEGPIQVDAQLATQAIVEFEFDATLGLTSVNGADTFYVEFGGNNRLHTRLTFQQPPGESFAARLGLLGLQVEAATLSFEHVVDLNFVGSELSAADLRADALPLFVDVVAMNAASGFTLNLPITAELDGVSLPVSSEITIVDNNVFDGQFDVATAIATNDAAAYSTLANLSPSELLSGFRELAGVLEALGNSAALDRDVPFRRPGAAQRGSEPGAGDCGRAG